MAELIFKDPRDYITFEFELRRSRRPAYSMRAFARDLKVSPSSLNDFMKGRVGMSKNRVYSIAESLKWAPTRTDHFMDLIASKYEMNPGEKQASLLRVRKRVKDGSCGLSLDSFKAISDWYHLVILEICDLRDDVSAQQIAEDLKLEAATVKEAIKRLQRLGLIHQTDKGLKPTEELNYFGDDHPSDAVNTFQSQILELTQKSLQEKPMEERNNQSIVFSIDGAEVEAMNEELRKATLNIINKYAQSKKRDNVQVFTMHTFSICDLGNK